jgi:uncharacterized protein
MSSVDLSTQNLILVITGLFSGFVDSIAGGGGLINLPVLTFFLTPGAHAIGTNKVAGTVAALIALLVYLRRGYMEWGKSIRFVIFTGIGAFFGSQVAPLLPPSVFKWLLCITCPLILWIIWKKDLWIRHDAPQPNSTLPMEYSIIFSGLLCGFYDGVWGPGSGTFMFLALILFAKLPLLVALTASKFANACSAFVALVSYGSAGYVHWLEGMSLSVGIAFGAFLGANFASKASVRAIRPALFVVVILLMFKLIY